MFDVREARDHGVDVAHARVAEHERGRQAHVGREVESRRRQRLRLVDQCFQLRLPLAADHDPVAQLRADVAQRVVDVAATRVHFGRDLVFDQRSSSLPVASSLRARVR